MNEAYAHRFAECRDVIDRILLVLKAELERAQFSRLLVHALEWSRLAKQPQIREETLEHFLEALESVRRQLDVHFEELEATRRVPVVGAQLVRPAPALELREQTASALVAQQM